MLLVYIVIETSHKQYFSRNRPVQIRYVLNRFVMSMHMLARIAQIDITFWRNILKVVNDDEYKLNVIVRHYALKAVYENHKHKCDGRFDISNSYPRVEFCQFILMSIKTKVRIYHVSFVKSHFFVLVQPFNQRDP